MNELQEPPSVGHLPALSEPPALSDDPFSRTPDKVHWAVAINHRNRTVGFVMILATLLAQMVHEAQSLATWVLLGFSFLVYPQLAYLHGRKASDPRRAEIVNLGIDAGLYGLWTAALGFPYWVAFILFTAASVNLTFFLGLPGFWLALVVYLASAGVGGVLTGWHMHPDAEPTATIIGMVLLTVYLAATVTEAHRRATQLYEQRLLTRAAEREVRHQLAENRALQEHLRELAHRDPMTGLFNRRYLEPTLAREVAKAQHERSSLAVMVIDVDHFKKVNDTYGHQAGDAVLTELGRLLREGCRGEDVACRFGGEEFVVMVPRLGAEGAAERAEAWRRAFAAAAVAHEGELITATLSIGLALYPDNGSTAEELIGSADAALYRAKHGGRNRVERARGREHSTGAHTLTGGFDPPVAEPNC